MSCMMFPNFSARLQRLLGLKTKAAARDKRTSQIMKISAPFNFKHETVSLPGLSEDEITLLKEKAAASRIGVIDGHDDIPSSFGVSPRKAPRAPPAPVRIVSPIVRVGSALPLSMQENVI
ncbi:hypothetical protein F5Y17DRAFT_78875 [Xylariaceae sp. FL0594]|nr:hypothetical protein F5Y17DRAFT_78875 [Xylariaceae sp. FL0594]